MKYFIFINNKCNKKIKGFVRFTKNKLALLMNLFQKLQTLTLVKFVAWIFLIKLTKPDRLQQINK